MILTILILAITIPALAPTEQVFYVKQAEAIKAFDSMLYAFQKVESNFNTDVVNRLGYSGILQEGPEMIAEANRICEITGNPARFTFPGSALDSLQAVQIWYVVQEYRNSSYSLKLACKIWNPLAGKKYYQKIRELI